MSRGLAKAGRLFQLKMGDGATPENFTIIGGLKASSIKLSAGLIDTTDMASNDWKELLSGYGVRSVSISGSGIFKNDAEEALIRSKFLNNLTWNYQLVDADLNIIQGSFMIKDLEYKGSDKDAVTYQFSMESNGAVTYTASGT